MGAFCSLTGKFKRSCNEWNLCNNAFFCKSVGFHCPLCILTEKQKPGSQG